MAQGKVPKFGAWEGGENFTEYFNVARNTRQNGLMINPNDPEKAAGSTTPEPEAKVKPTPQETRPNVPQFGEWGDQSEGEAGYTTYFDKARENRGKPPNMEELSREPQLNRDIRPPTSPAPTKDPRVNVLGPANKDKGKSPNMEELSREPKLNRDIKPPPSPAPTKDPWVKVLGPTNKAMPEKQGSFASTVDSVSHMRQPLVAQVPKIGCKVPGTIIDGRALASNSERSFHTPQQPEKVPALPPFAVWNDDPSKTAGFNGAFARLKEEKLTPLHHNASSSHNNQPQSKEEPKDVDRSRCNNCAQEIKKKGFWKSFFGKIMPSG